MEKTIFKNDAKSIVDSAFETKLFKDDVTRDHMNVFEDLIQFMLESRFESYKKIEELTKRIEKNK